MTFFSGGPFATLSRRRNKALDDQCWLRRSSLESLGMIYADKASERE